MAAIISGPGEVHKSEITRSTVRHLDELASQLLVPGFPIQSSTFLLEEFREKVLLENGGLFSRPQTLYTKFLYLC